MKKIVASVLTLLMTFGLSTTGFAQTSNNGILPLSTNSKIGQALTSENAVKQYSIDHNIPLVMTQKSSTKNTTVNTLKPNYIKTLTNIDDIRAYCTEHNMPLIDSTGKLLDRIEILESTDIASTSASASSVVTPNLVGDFTVIDYAINFTGSSYCAYAAGPYPGTVTLSETYSEEATLSSSISVSSSTVSATVGFDVTKSYSISPSYSITPSQAHGGARIYAYPRYQGSAFEIWRLAWQVGYGTAYRVIGTQYAVTYYK
jgi:hypothetical protein